MPSWPEPLLPNMGELMAWPAELYNWLGRSFCCSRHLLGGAAASWVLSDLLFPFSAMASNSAAFALAALAAALSLGGGVGTCDSVGLATGFSGPAWPGRGIWATVFTATAPHLRSPAFVRPPSHAVSDQRGRNGAMHGHREPEGRRHALGLIEDVGVAHHCLPLLSESSGCVTRLTWNLAAPRAAATWAMGSQGVCRSALK